MIEPLPPGVMSTDGSGRALRLVKAIFRLLDTRALSVDTGNGVKSVPLRRLNGAASMDQTPQAYTGDIKLHAFGWSNDGTKPLWRLEQDDPLPCTILGVTMELKVND